MILLPLTLPAVLQSARPSSLASSMSSSRGRSCARRPPTDQSVLSDSKVHTVIEVSPRDVIALWRRAASPYSQTLFFLSFSIWVQVVSLPGARPSRRSSIFKRSVKFLQDTRYKIPLLIHWHCGNWMVCHETYYMFCNRVSIYNNNFRKNWQEQINVQICGVLLNKIVISFFSFLLTSFQLELKSLIIFQFTCN